MQLLNWNGNLSKLISLFNNLNKFLNKFKVLFYGHSKEMFISKATGENIIVQ